MLFAHVTKNKSLVVELKLLNNVINALSSCCQTTPRILSVRVEFTLLHDDISDQHLNRSSASQVILQQPEKRVDVSAKNFNRECCRYII